MHDGPDRRKQPRAPCQFPIRLEAPDGSGALRGTALNLGGGGLLLALYQPMPYFGLEPYAVTFRLGALELMLRGNWEIRGNARVVAIEFLPGQDFAVSTVRAFVKRLVSESKRPSGRTTRRLTPDRRDEATTIRRMLARDNQLDAFNPFLEEVDPAPPPFVKGHKEGRLEALVRRLGFPR